MEAHFTAVQNLVELLPRKTLKRFVQIGSSDEYGNATAPQDEQIRESPISPYSLGKVASTQFMQMLHRTEQFPSVVLRLFLTYGPGQDSKRFIPQIIKGCFNDSVFPTSGGQQLRDFCYVSDTVGAIIKTLQSEKHVIGQVFNVASGQPLKIRTMIEKIREIVGRGRPDFGKVPYRPGENMKLYANISKIQEAINWKPKTGLEEGLKKTIDWYATRE